MSVLHIFSTIGLLFATVMMMSVVFGWLIKRRSFSSGLRTIFAAFVIVILSTVLTPVDIAKSAIGAAKSLSSTFYDTPSSEEPDSINDSATTVEAEDSGNTGNAVKDLIIKLGQEPEGDLSEGSNDVKKEEYAGKIND